MILDHLTILNYKNIASAELHLSPGMNCFIGSNGEGKTNLLDAIYFLSLCKSASAGTDSLLIRHGEDFMMLEGTYRREDETQETIRCGLKRGQKKTFRRGSKPYRRLAEHVGLIPLVMISPADQQLIMGGSEERRRFMDIVVSQYDRTYLESLMKYNKALLQRNTLLRADDEPDPELLGLYEEQMAQQGEYIFVCRQRYIEQFVPIFQDYYRQISPEHEEVSLAYISHCQRGPLLDVIRRDRAKDRAVGYSLHGIHRDELEMQLGGYPLRREGSQGQSKSYLVALKLAQFQFLRQVGSHTTPLLLLDDIFDKLDASRVEQIVHIVSAPGFGQVFITDTNRDHLSSILSTAATEYTLFHVTGGEVTT